MILIIVGGVSFIIEADSLYFRSLLTAKTSAYILVLAHTCLVIIKSGVIQGVQKKRFWLDYRKKLFIFKKRFHQKIYIFCSFFKFTARKILKYKEMQF